MTSSTPMTSARKVIPIATADDLARRTEGGGAKLSSLPPLSLYIHVPWCVRKCPYCDFNSHEAGATLPEQQYLSALMSDLEQALPLIWGRQVHSVFIGGGTPSLLSSEAVDSLLAGIRARLSLWPDAEITLEANPGAVEADRFRSYAASGINRLSLGIQSFNDEHLKALGRIHDTGQAKRAVELAKDSFARVNLDLMYGLPGQSARQFEEDLLAACSFQTEHLSLYQLTLEPNTVFAKYPPVLPDENSIEQMEELIDQLVIGAGWQRYEVSAYAQSGAKCRHNLNYWTFGDYLGIGPGAHSKISFHDRIIRQARTRSPDQWMANVGMADGSHVSEQRELDPNDLLFEFFLNALRLKEGVSIDTFESRTGLRLGQAFEAINIAAAKGLLLQEGDQIRATDLGWRHLNDLQAMFLK